MPSFSASKKAIIIGRSYSIVPGSYSEKVKEICFYHVPQPTTMKEKDETEEYSAKQS